MLEKNHEYELKTLACWRPCCRRVSLSTVMLAARVAMGYTAMVCRSLEIISEGNVGLMRASDRYDPKEASALPLLRYGGSGLDTRLHPALMVACEDRHDCEPEEALLQATLGKNKIAAFESGDLRPTRWLITSESRHLSKGMSSK